MTHVTCRLTAKNRDQLRNPTLGNLLWATFTLFYRTRYRPTNRLNPENSSGARNVQLPLCPLRYRYSRCHQHSEFYGSVRGRISVPG